MSAADPKNPLIVQSDHTILVEVDNPRYGEARDRLVRFAELVKSPEHIHTYRLTPLSIWNACAVGMAAAAIQADLTSLTKYPIPEHVLASVRDFAGRYGRVQIACDPRGLILTTHDLPLAEEIVRQKLVAHFLRERLGPQQFLVDPVDRGRLKQALVKIGFPAEDLAGYTIGEELPVELRAVSRRGQPFALRPYQQEAAEVFHAGGSDRGGSGVIVLPCGGGKTIVGLACMAYVKSSTLILVTSVTAARQWIQELLDKTGIPETMIGEYSGAVKEVRPVTLATYQIMTHRSSQGGAFTHLNLFDQRNWGLIVYDEVHLLPAPVFQITATLQARRRLGLTATLVREDGREEDVFALIGPKKVDIPWKEMEAEGWIAKARCTEIRLPMTKACRFEYAVAPARQKFRIASENPEKLKMVRRLLDRHADTPTLIIGMYVEQIKQMAEDLNIPILTGATPQKTRDAIYSEFKAGRLSQLIVSKIANFSVDLPDAAVAIQISGTFGSRQEEAQRLGRVLRPKPGENQAHFYSIVSHDSVEQEFAMKRQLFLCEQGYEYAIWNLENSSAPLPVG